MNHFTATEIATAVGKSPRVVRRWLSNVRVASVRVISGNPTSSYSIESLPSHVQIELKSAADQRGFRTVEELLIGKSARWEPEIPWNEVCPEQQAEAAEVQRALLPLIDRRNDTSIACSEFEAEGARVFEAVTGKQITRERWRYLLNRTLERDRGASQFHRVELFLPGNLKRAPSKQARSGDEEFSILETCLANFRNPAEPSNEESDALWIEAVELFNGLCASRTGTAKKVKRALLDYLWRRASFLAKTKNALRANFDRKFKMYQDGSGDVMTLLDGRTLKRGETKAAPIPQGDIDKLVWHAARNCGGRTTQAVRELGERGEASGLSRSTLDLINAPHTSKSHVNRRLFSRVHRDVELISPYLLGKKAKDDATPSLRRDYSNLRSMSALTSDDFTMPVYCYVPDGKGWWILTRGQILLMIDCRSLKILGFSIQPERNYNALVIRSLMNRTCRKWGLPRVWVLENGIWKKSHLVKGAPKEWSEGKSWAEFKPGWAKLGVRFIHAKKARSKPAELVGGLLQNLMERVPGYCGRDERRDCPEAVKRNKLAVEARRVEPHGLFLSFDAWEEELGRLIAMYNSNVQQGTILQGLSPDQAFEAHWPHNDPPMKLDASCWHLLAHYVSERTVGVDGIRFKLGNEQYIYRDENTSALRGQRILSWFDPDCAEFLGITDLAGRNPVLVQRESKVDFLASLDRDSDAGRHYESEQAKVSAHNAYPRARFNILKATFEPTFRKNLVRPGVAHVAETFTAERAGHWIDEKKRASNTNRSIKRARKLGLPAALVRSGDALVDEGMEMMLKAERNQAPESTEKGNPE